MPDAETKKSSNWGGRRPGAGNKRVKNPRVTVSINISHLLKATILKESKDQDISFSRAAENRLKR